MLVRCELICKTGNKESNEKLVLREACSSEKKVHPPQKKPRPAPKQILNKNGWVGSAPKLWRGKLLIG